MGIFSPTKKSEHVNGICCICKSKIDYLYKPCDRYEYIELFRYYDIDLIYICNRCGSLRHVRCSSERKEKIRLKIPNITSGSKFGDALRNAFEGGVQERKDFLDLLEKETIGLDCPQCGSYKTWDAFVKKDGSIIKVKSGKRVD